MEAWKTKESKMEDESLYDSAIQQKHNVSLKDEPHVSLHFLVTIL